MLEVINYAQKYARIIFSSLPETGTFYEYFSDRQDNNNYISEQVGNSPTSLMVSWEMQVS